MNASCRTVVFEVLETRRFASATALASAADLPAAAIASASLAWKTKAPDPIKREEAVSFTSSGKLYVIGGYVNAKFQATQRVDVYDPKTNAWTRLKDSPTKITHTGLAVDPKTGIVWMVGGYIGDFPEPPGTNVVWKYNPKTDTWTRGPNLPVARGSGGAAIVNNVLYYFSGNTADRQTSSPNSYTLNLGAANAQWHRAPNFPSPRNHFGVEAVGSFIFALGGQTGIEDTSVEVGSDFVYNTKHGTWVHTTPMPREYSHFSSTISLYKDRYIFIAGGEDPHNNAVTDVRMFDTQTRSWTSETGLPDARRAAAGNIIGDDYVVTGGFKYEANQENTTYVADLANLRLT